MAAYLRVERTSPRFPKLTINIIVHSVVRFYSYRTANAAIGSIVELHYERGDEVDQFIGDLVKTANEAGVKSDGGYSVQRDNHVVFEVKGGYNDLPFWVHISDWTLHISTRCEVGRW